MSNHNSPSGRLGLLAIAGVAWCLILGQPECSSVAREDKVENKDLSEISSTHYLALPVNVTKEMIGKETPIRVAYILKEEATVQVFVYDSDKKVAISGKAQKS